MSQNAAVTASSVTVSPEQIRNVVLIGHSQSGKTTLADALSTGTHTAVTRQTSVSSPWRFGLDTRLACYVSSDEELAINVIDTPGHPDFAGDVHAGLRAADAAVFVVSASGGMDAATQQWWRECDAVGLPRVIAVTKLDSPFADFDETVALCQRLFDPAVTPTHLPLLGDDANTVAGLIGLLSTSVYDYSHGHPPQIIAPETVHLEGIAEARAQLIESVLAHSEDDLAMSAYLTGEDIDTEALVSDLESATAQGTLFPVIPIDPVRQVGVDQLRLTIVDGFNSPVHRIPPAVSATDGTPAAPLVAQPADRLAAQVISTRIQADSRTQCLLRVFSGTLIEGDTVCIDRDDSAPGSARLERVTDLQTPLGVPVSQCGAGDICAVVLTNARPGDTISGPDSVLRLSPWNQRSPQFPSALSAAPAQYGAMSTLVATDPSARLELNPDTRQLMLWCLGDTHAEAVLNRLRTHGFDLEATAIRAAHREKFTTSSRGVGTYQHGKHTVDYDLEVIPLADGAGNSITHGQECAIASEYEHLFDEGIREALRQGAASPHPIVDVRIRVRAATIEGEPTDSAMFTRAAGHALHEAAKGSTAIVTPIDTATITVPNEYARPVMTDLTASDGTIRDSAENDDGNTVINVDLPAATLWTYAPKLRAITSGSGRFHAVFSHYARSSRGEDDAN